MSHDIEYKDATFNDLGPDYLIYDYVVSCYGGRRYHKLGIHKSNIYATIDFFVLLKKWNNEDSDGRVYGAI